MRNFAKTAVFVAIFFAGAGHGNSDEPRTWRSADGMHRVEAQFVDYDTRTKIVRLKSGNETIDIPLSRLSKSDQRYLKVVARKQSTDPSAEIQATGTERSSNENDSATSDRRTSRGKRGQLFGIHWTLDLKHALNVAAGSPSVSDDRPVMWLRVLGDLNGFM